MANPITIPSKLILLKDLALPFIFCPLDPVPAAGRMNSRKDRRNSGLAAVGQFRLSLNYVSGLKDQEAACGASDSAYESATIHIPRLLPHLRSISIDHSTCAIPLEIAKLINLVDKMSAVQEELFQRRFYFRYLRVDKKSRQWGMYVATCGKSIILPEDGSYLPRQHPPLDHFDWEHGRALNEYQLVYIPEGSGHFETKDSDSGGQRNLVETRNLAPVSAKTRDRMAGILSRIFGQAS